LPKEFRITTLLNEHYIIRRSVFSTFIIISIFLQNLKNRILFKSSNKLTQQKKQGKINALWTTGSVFQNSDSLNEITKNKEGIKSFKGYC